jgi:hypothetical protein
MIGPPSPRLSLLAHAVSDRVEAAAYRRGDLFQKRRQSMDARGEILRRCTRERWQGGFVCSGKVDIRLVIK